MNFFGDPEIYQRSYTLALEANRDAVDQINNFKRELDAVRANLEENRKHLLVNVIVPISSKAMIRAQFVHTNEIYVNLGDRWFVKTSCERALEIAERMIERCNENIRQWEKETNLLSSNLEMLDEISVFPTETLKDIVEPYDEAYETCWREQHKKRVLEHRKRELNNKSTDAELFQRLERLEIEEAAKRMYGEVDSNGKLVDLGHMKTEEGAPLPARNLIRSKTEENSRGVSVVHFKHSDKIVKSLDRTQNERVVSPGDIYREFLLDLPPKLDPTPKPQRVAKSKNREKGCIIGDIVEKQFTE